MKFQQVFAFELSVISVFLFFTVTVAQIGSDCSETRTCYAHQSCYHGYCSCERGFVRSHKHCFRVKSYGQTCFFDVQCNDHRMVCEAENADTLVKRCLCDRLHVWSKEQKECVMSMNVTAMLASLEVSKFSEKVEKRNEEIFSVVVVAGITVVILGMLITFLCIFYGCCLYECFDKMGRLEEGEAKEQSKPIQSSKQHVPRTIMRSGFRKF